MTRKMEHTKERKKLKKRHIPSKGVLGGLSLEEREGSRSESNGGTAANHCHRSERRRHLRKRGKGTKGDGNPTTAEGSKRFDFPQGLEVVHRRRKGRKRAQETVRERVAQLRRGSTMTLSDGGNHCFPNGTISNRGCTTRWRLTLSATPPERLRCPTRRQVAPLPHICVCLRRVKTVRFMKRCRFTFRSSLKRPLRERRRLEKSPVALPNRRAVTAEAQCSTQTFSLIRDRASTLARIWPEGRGLWHDEYRTIELHEVCYFVVRSFLDWTITPEHDPDSSDGALGGAVQRQTNHISFERLKISSFTRKVGKDTLYTCLKTPRSSVCRASLPQAPDATRSNGEPTGSFVSAHCSCTTRSVRTLPPPLKFWAWTSLYLNSCSSGRPGTRPPLRQELGSNQQCLSMHVHSSYRRWPGPPPHAEVTTCRGGCTKTAPARPSDA